jgi:hypothetical protein
LGVEQADLVTIWLIRHGSRYEPGSTVDPSESDQLLEVGVAAITSYVEQLGLLDLVREPAPLFGARGGMWIGYQLSDHGRQLAADQAELKRVVAPLIGGPANEVSQAVADLQAECAGAQLSEIYRDDFLQSLDEIRICFDAHCFIATIALSGKILEVCLKEVLSRHGIQPDPKAMVGSLIKSIRERLPSIYLDPTLLNVVNIINMSRITAVHAQERIPVPSRDQAVMVIFAMRDVVMRTLVSPGPVEEM